MSVTVELTGELADRLEHAAAARGLSAGDLVTELVAQHVPGRRTLRFAGVAAVGEDTAARHREIVTDAVARRHDQT